MDYKVWENGIVRDATPEEIEQMEHLPPPYTETNIPVDPGEMEE